jgi:CheY-like chemotaxis protein
MATKVLVFESDSAFAGELRNELGKLGCATTVVDDGNVGLQQAGSDRPDLILLSIELPRMNGFSVCNKLKKDPSLKDVPLIIMSSESSDETFEQHKKLRTRAEDYVHKPIAFGELLQHIQGFVEIDAGDVQDSEGAIVIDEDIEVASDYLIEDVGDPGSKRPEKKVDADIDAFAESAFGRLEASAPPIDARPPNAVANGMPVEARPTPQRSVPPPPRHATAVPKAQAPGAEPVELQRVRDELARAKEKLDGAEREAEEARREADRLRLEAGEAERLGREVEELKTKIASSPRAGGVSSRDFLDLREALNKKDKEILSLREQLSKKDKEIVETQDKMLALERANADHDDRLIVLEREIEGAKEKAEALVADKELAKKAGEDLKTRFEKAKAELDGRDRVLNELRAKHSNELSAVLAKADADRAEAEQALANARAEQARLLDQTEERRQADVEQARRDAEALLAEAREKSEGEKGEALSAQAAQLSQEHEQSLERARAEAKDAVAAAHAATEEKVEAALKALGSEHAAKVLEIENDRDARIANIEAKASREIGEANDKLAKVDVEFSAVRGELESLREAKRISEEGAEARIASLEKSLAEAERVRAGLDGELAAKIDRLAAETVRADKAHAKWESDKQSLERAKDALAVALSQIEDAEGRV